MEMNFWKKWLLAALLADAIIIMLSIAFPGSEEIVYHRFREHQWVTFVSVVKLIMIATLALSCFTVWTERKHTQERLMWACFSICFLFLALDEWFFVRERLCGLTGHHGLFEKGSAVLYMAVGITLFAVFLPTLRKYRNTLVLLLLGGFLFALKIVAGLLDTTLGLTFAYMLGGTLKLIGESFLIVAFLEALRQVSTYQKL